MKYVENKKHISQVSHGDTILHNGLIKTLTNGNINRCPFVGITIWGDSYLCGHKPVTVLTELKDD